MRTNIHHKVKPAAQYIGDRKNQTWTPSYPTGMLKIKYLKFWHYFTKNQNCWPYASPRNKPLDDVTLL